MTDLEKAKALLEAEGYGCVLFGEEGCHASKRRGVSSLVEWLEKGLDMKGYAAADKIVGKAAAMLFVLGGVSQVYAAVLSQKGLAVLEENSISVQYDTLVEGIINRAGTGSCPMELAVAELTEPAQALPVLRETVDRLRKEAKMGQ